MSTAKATGILNDIALECNGFKIGEPWRFHEASLTAVIPITRAVKTERPYRLISEAAEDVTISDTGAINLLDVFNHGHMPVLFIAGMYVTGATQSRAFAVSDILMPGESVKAQCVCVHHARHIEKDAKVTVDGYAPGEVRRNFYHPPEHGDGPTGARQFEVWESVNRHAGLSGGRMSQAMATALRMSQSPGEERLHSLAFADATFSASENDLAGRIREGGQKLKEVLKMVPETGDQVGLVTVASGGAESLDTFENPKSWTAWRQHVLKAEATRIADLSDRSGLFEFKAEKAKEVIKEMLRRPFTETVVLKRSHSTTVNLNSRQFAGQVVLLNGEPVHCALVRTAGQP